MMSSNADQAWQIMVYMGCGGIFGVVAGIRQALTAYTKPSPVRRFAGDIVFCILAVIALFLVSLTASAGELRMTTVGFTVIGCVLLRAVSLPLFTAFFRHMRIVFSFSKRIGKRIVLPIARFVSFFCKKFRFFCKKGLRYKYVMMYNGDE